MWTYVENITIDLNLMIEGAGAQSTFIDGTNGIGSVISTSIGTSIEISGVTVQNGLSMVGGGINNTNATLTVTDSVIADNIASIQGGGISNSSGLVTIIRTTIRDNSTSPIDMGGGGIFNGSGILALFDSAVSDNVVNAGSQAGAGGGVLNSSGDSTITNSTISGNSVPSAGGPGFGAGIHNISGTVRISHTTIAENMNAFSAVGISNTSGTVEIRNSIIANAIGATDNCSGALTSLGFNISTDDSCGLNQATDFPSTDPLIGGLMDNGGPTNTHAPSSGDSSIIVDFIPLADCVDTDGTPLTVDQTGTIRPQGLGCDIGAFEIIPPIYVVNNSDDTDDGTCDTTHCSLREAINTADLFSFSRIHFDLPSNSLEIQLQSSLSAIFSPIEFDGTTQPGYAGTPIVEIDGSTPGGWGFEIHDDNVTIKGLVIKNFSDSGIFMFNFTDNHRIVGNYIGIEADGVTPAPNGYAGINILGNDGQNIVIGGPNPEDRNVISGNNGRGILIENGPFSGFVTNAGNVVQGNYIGTDATGTISVPNQGDGVGILDIGGNVIGGPGQGEGNLISGNNGNGVHIEEIGFFSRDNIVQGNFIGSDISGTADLGNTLDGIRLDNGWSNEFGGPTPPSLSGGAGNLISGNGGSGIVIGGAIAFTSIEGNYIGTNVTGDADIPNESHGVLIDGKDDFNAITNNVISGNIRDGIRISGGLFLPEGDFIDGNKIGTDMSGSTAIPNLMNGIFIEAGDKNEIGGGEGNIIAFNNGNGVTISSGTGNLISKNSIFSNGGIGIDLGGDGVTDNDFQDIDTGANDAQNYPSISSNINVVSGTLDGRESNQSYELEFFSSVSCDPSLRGEGAHFVNVITLNTDVNGDGVFVTSFDPADLIGSIITVTATNSGNNNTSEFSECAPVLFNEVPTADDQNVNDVQENTPKDITLSGSDIETDVGSLAFVIEELPSNGTLSEGATVIDSPSLPFSLTTNLVTYTPDPLYSGSDSFTFSTMDLGDPDGCGTPGPNCAAAETSALATVSITVSDVRHEPTAVNDSLPIDEDTVLNGNVLAANPTTNDSDLDGDALTVTHVNGSASDIGSSITLASGALLTLNSNGNFTYDPSGKFESLAVGGSSVDSFTYTIDDVIDGTDSATVEITINGANDLPQITSTCGTSATIDQAYVCDVNATDIDNGDTQTYSLMTSPTGMSIQSDTGVINWTPTSAQVSTHSVTVKVQDSFNGEVTKNP